nr:eyes absent homolog 4 [Ipomoea batatas]
MLPLSSSYNLLSALFFCGVEVRSANWKTDLDLSANCGDLASASASAHNVLLCSKTLAVNRRSTLKINHGLPLPVLELPSPSNDFPVLELPRRDGDKSKGFWQRIVYDYVLKYCTDCYRFGHAVSNCRRMRNGEGGDEPENVNTTGENGEGEQLPIMVEVCQENRATPPVCGNVSMRIGEPNAPIAKEIEQAQGECAEIDVSGEAEKGEEGDDEDDKQGDSSSKDDGSKDESSQPKSYRFWAENLKKKAGEDSELLKVEGFFQNALRDLGKEVCDGRTEELVKKANGLRSIRNGDMIKCWNDLYDETDSYTDSRFTY